ncbi:phosphatidylglycerophosphatase A [Puniceicoccales bacterium CK1056]|uniref:Phosphatidylglycerophosphatase A n=1 Tax=Oceanipulchritudo coccoides TaxID=2706888 RepID=A0A6B2M275_9BACT|nr:phosphatidylglycerophosphatase A [Oceanipulchritudo coccoides]NDV61830.1 phosphatidylglycerophosphatase A [Oceanipulchritudo coccoides]
MKPEVRLFLAQLPSQAVISACTCGPVGNWGKAPGTNGTLLGILLYTLVFFQIGLVGQVVLTALLVGLAILLCDEGERRMAKRDPGEMILDEVVAVPICFIGMNGLMAETGHVWLYMLAGFGLFRLFDILKPFGIKNLQKYPGGIGVVVDDLAAAVATNITLRLLIFALGFGGWI